jgi:molybdopterin-containing oxidoreductase family iron-sulfur binding subunit
MGATRREFLEAGAIIGAGAAVAATAAVTARLDHRTTDPVGEETVRHIDVLPSVKPSPEEDVLIRMQRDLARAMAKPVEQRRWVMIIDTRKCVGCHACTVGCVAENHLPPGVVYRPVVTEEYGEYPHVQMRFFPRPCMQCDVPPCVPVCPVHATWKRPDGVVVVNYDRCIGCGYCITACPYNARSRDLGEYWLDGAAESDTPSELPILGQNAPWEKIPCNEYAKSWDRTKGSPVGNARKCHFCLHRLEVGQLPMCVTTCIGRATYFGDANDPDSLVSELMAAPNVIRLLEHLGTEPRVRYLI